ncbi:MAG TPA: Gfo/Idh/MocA family oxidoreductase, partial [Candidatus Limnocylindrales bacterium]|nr:Gfo/Idh/MocA family oxidoreductase [Candidatus Limnocylindrales bacterium]
MSERARGGISDKVRFSVVGAGEFGRNHARVYREMDSVELVGVLDQNAARGEAIAQEFGIRAFKGIEELRGAVDAASVAVPTVAHAEVGCRLMELG